MISRRGFGMNLGKMALASTFVGAGAEAVFAQRAMVQGAPPGTVWLNANEYPDGPCQAAMFSMAGTIGAANRYHYQEFPDIYAAIAKSENLEPPQMLVGAGSTEILHTAIEAFCSTTQPLIVIDPTYEFPGEVANAAGIPVTKVPLRKDYSADVKKIVAEAAKAKAGLVYLCNPNNPTSSITTKDDIAWLVANLPAGWVLLVDEAYLHFTVSPQVESALRYVRDGKNVVVTRTFSKIYGMAGLRVGMGFGKPELIKKMAPYRNNVISYVSAKAIIAALSDDKLVPQRRELLASTRTKVCDWLTKKKLTFIEPHANFMMIDVKRPGTEVIPKMLAKGVAIGRPFPALSNMVRVSIGTEQEMVQFANAFQQVLELA